MYAIRSYYADEAVEVGEQRPGQPGQHGGYHEGRQLHREGFDPDRRQPCRVIAPILEEVAKEFEGKVRVAKLNVDDSPDIASQFGVRGIPTLILFKEGQIKGQMVGVNPKNNIIQLIQKNL